ncbi:MAG: hypothetical protein HXY40_17310 [Chloroflexi bacterium]|nr:hypothetical protein [Chloroflexota bacterium]
MKIRVLQNKVRLRRSPEFKTTNVVRLLAKDSVFENPRKHGDWWKVADGYIHASMVEEIADAPVEPTKPAEPEKPGVGLFVPYRSQWDVDASNRSSDCGQTCVAMLADWKGVKVRVNDLKIQSSRSGLTTAKNLVDNFATIGLKAKEVAVPLAEIPPLPAICLMWYGGLKRSSVQDRGFRGWHWLVLLEQTADYVVTHDPNYFDKRRDEGAFKRYSSDEWNKAFIPYMGSKRTAVVLDA